MAGSKAPVEASFIGLDLGTSGCRGVAIDAGGNAVATARMPLPASSRPRPGWSEQQPDDWWAATTTVLRRVIARCPLPVAAIAVDGTSSTLLLTDAQGLPCSRALMYDDRRAVAQAARIDRVAPAESPARGAGSALARLLYLTANPHSRHAAHALHQADWISGRLCGRFGNSDENNALKLGYDPCARSWPDWLERLDLAVGLLPSVVPVGVPLGRIDSRVATSLGLSTDCVVVSGTTDSNAATLAAGVARPGDAVTSLGSTLVIKVLSTQPVFAAKYGIYSHRIGDLWLVGGASNSGGAVLRRFFSDRRLVELSARIDPDKPTHLDYYPLPAPGERFPDNDPHRAPVLEPRPGSDARFLQGMLEGIATIEAKGYARLAELGAPRPLRVVTCGGGAANNAWRRIRERRLGVPVLRATQTEAAFGAALLARDAMLQRRTGSAAQS